MSLKQQVKTFQCTALGAENTSGVLKKLTIERRLPTNDDVLVEIYYSGICHSDVHQLRGEWKQDVHYPMVPGHEIVGLVKEIGPNVKNFKVGDRVGVGCMVDSCRECEQCVKGEEQYCHKQLHSTYNCCIKDPSKIFIKNSEQGELLFGGYSTFITVTESFVVHIPDSIPLEVAAPLLCAGITSYSPLVQFGKYAQQIRPNHQLHVGVAGFGGLGDMAVKIAKKMGYHVTVLSSSPRKKEAALKCGADAFVVSSDPQQTKLHQKSLDLIIDTISADHSISRLLTKFLKIDGILCLVGLPSSDIQIAPFDIVGGRRMLVGSSIGGIRETQEMLDFCGKNNVFPDVELINAKDVNHKIHLLSTNSSDVRRFVIRVKETLSVVNPNDKNWKVEDEPEIKISNWKVHPQARIFPKNANVHQNSSASL